MPEPQSYKNHTRFDPAFHFFLLPLLLANIIFSIVAIIRHYPDHRNLYTWWAIMAIVLFVAVGLIRTYSLKVQNRVIRLEERLRFVALLPADLNTRSYGLTPGQMVGLRFASDAELPTLVRRALDENLTSKQIKEAITDWRPDYLRV